MHGRVPVSTIVVDLLLNAVEATLLVEDPALLADFTEWLGSLLTAHGFDDSVPRDMQRALADGLRPVAPAAADLLPA